MKKCIQGGMSKINVNKLILNDYLVHLQKKAPTAQLTTLIEEGVAEIRKLMEWQMDVCDSTGKAL